MPIRLLLAVALTIATAAAIAAECRVTDPELQGFYRGGCRNGLAHGSGTARGSAEYVGEFRKGLKHGRGVKTWAWGDRYEGDFVDDRKHGRGMYVWGAGSPWAGERYVGDYVADRRHGRGQYFWPSGDRFEGEWKDDGRYGYSAMELRRQAAERARVEVMGPGVQVCGWGRIGIARQTLQVGRVESVEEHTLQVRLLRVEGDEAAVVLGGPQPGALVSGARSDWTPCL